MLTAMYLKSIVYILCDLDVPLKLYVDILMCYLDTFAKFKTYARVGLNSIHFLSTYEYVHAMYKCDCKVLN